VNFEGIPFEGNKITRLVKVPLLVLAKEIEALGFKSTIEVCDLINPLLVKAPDPCKTSCAPAAVMLAPASKLNAAVPKLISDVVALVSVNAICPFTVLVVAVDKFNMGLKPEICNDTSCIVPLVATVGTALKTNVLNPAAGRSYSGITIKLVRN
jgi:hypothetical protein